MRSKLSGASPEDQAAIEQETALSEEERVINRWEDELGETMAQLGERADKISSLPSSGEPAGPNGELLGQMREGLSEYYRATEFALRSAAEQGSPGIGKFREAKAKWQALREASQARYNGVGLRRPSWSAAVVGAHRAGPGGEGAATHELPPGGDASGRVTR